MDLILWRHTEAEEGSPDLNRALTAKGQKQAHKMGGWLDRNLPANLQVLCSPALRTMQTADALGRQYTMRQELAPDATPHAVLAAANWPAAREPVLIVGHQPTLGQIASLLISGSAQYWTVRKGNVWWISKQDQENGGGSFIRAVLAPEFTVK